MRPERPPESVPPLVDLADAFEEKTEFPTTDDVLFHVSAGRDCRPLVFFSRGYQEPRRGGLRVPGLVIQTCLGKWDLDALVACIREEKPIYDDAFTTIRYENVRPLTRRRSVFSRHERFSRRRVTFDPGSPRARYGFDAFLCEAVIADKKSGYVERTPMLYLFGENIASFDALVANGPVKVRTLVATREGCGFGGCRKSIIDHVYTDHAPDCFRSRGFEPEVVVAFQDFTHGHLVEGLRRAGIEGIPTPLGYLPEGPDSGSLAHVVRLAYPNEIPAEDPQL